MSADFSEELDELALRGLDDEEAHALRRLRAALGEVESVRRRRAAILIAKAGRGNGPCAENEPAVEQPRRSAIASEVDAGLAGWDHSVVPGSDPPEGRGA